MNRKWMAGDDWIVFLIPLVTMALLAWILL